MQALPEEARRPVARRHRPARPEDHLARVEEAHGPGGEDLEAVAPEVPDPGAPAEAVELGERAPALAVPRRDRVEDERLGRAVRAQAPEVRGEVLEPLDPVGDGGPEAPGRGRQDVDAAPARPQHAPALGVELREVEDVLEDVRREDDVERPLPEREVPAVVVDHREAAVGAVVRRGQVDRDDAEAALREEPRLDARAAAELEDARARRQVREHPLDLVGAQDVDELYGEHAATSAWTSA